MSDNLERRAAELVFQVRDLVVKDAESAAFAGTLAQLGAAMEQEISRQWDPVCRAADEAHKVAVRQRAALLAMPLEVKRTAGDKVTAWQREQARLHREAEEARRAEHLRRMAVEDARVQQENARLLHALDEQRLARALDAERRGDTDGAAQIIAAPIPAPTVAPRPVFMPMTLTPEPITVPGISAREDWDFRVVDPSLIPRSYLVVDDVAIRKVVRALKGRTTIPGVEVFPKPVTSVSSR